MLTVMYVTLSVFGVCVSVLTFAHWVSVIWRRAFQ